MWREEGGAQSLAPPTLPSAWVTHHCHRCHCSCFHHGPPKVEDQNLHCHRHQGGMWGGDDGRASRSSLGPSLLPHDSSPPPTVARPPPLSVYSLFKWTIAIKIIVRIIIASAISVTFTCQNFFINFTTIMFGHAITHCLQCWFFINCADEMWETEILTESSFYALRFWLTIRPCNTACLHQAHRSSSDRKVEVHI